MASAPPAYGQGGEAPPSYADASGTVHEEKRSSSATGLILAGLFFILTGGGFAIPRRQVETKAYTTIRAIGRWILPIGTLGALLALLYLIYETKVGRFIMTLSGSLVPKRSSVHGFGQIPIIGFLAWFLFLTGATHRAYKESRTLKVIFTLGGYLIPRKEVFESNWLYEFGRILGTWPLIGVLGIPFAILAVVLHVIWRLMVFLYGIPLFRAIITLGGSVVPARLPYGMIDDPAKDRLFPKPSAHQIERWDGIVEVGRVPIVGILGLLAGVAILLWSIPYNIWAKLAHRFPILRHLLMTVLTLGGWLIPNTYRIMPRRRPMHEKFNASYGGVAGSIYASASELSTAYVFGVLAWLLVLLALVVFLFTTAWKLSVLRIIITTTGWLIPKVAPFKWGSLERVTLPLKPREDDGESMIPYNIRMISWVDEVELRLRGTLGTSCTYVTGRYIGRIPFIGGLGWLFVIPTLLVWIARWSWNFLIVRVVLTLGGAVLRVARAPDALARLADTLDHWYAGGLVRAASAVAICPLLGGPLALLLLLQAALTVLLIALYRLTITKVLLTAGAYLLPGVPERPEHEMSWAERWIRQGVMYRIAAALKPIILLGVLAWPFVILAVVLGLLSWLWSLYPVRLLLTLGAIALPKSSRFLPRNGVYRLAYGTGRVPLLGVLAWPLLVLAFVWAAVYWFACTSVARVVWTGLGWLVPRRRAENRGYYFMRKAGRIWVIGGVLAILLVPIWIGESIRVTGVVTAFSRWLRGGVRVLMFNARLAGFLVVSYPVQYAIASVNLYFANHRWEGVWRGMQLVPLYQRVPRSRFIEDKRVLLWRREHVHQREEIRDALIAGLHRTAGRVNKEYAARGGRVFWHWNQPTYATSAYDSFCAGMRFSPESDDRRRANTAAGLADFLFLRISSYVDAKLADMRDAAVLQQVGPGSADSVDEPASLPAVPTYDEAIGEAAPAPPALDSADTPWYKRIPPSREEKKDDDDDTLDLEAPSAPAATLEEKKEARRSSKSKGKSRENKDAGSKTITIVDEDAVDVEAGAVSPAASIDAALPVLSVEVVDEVFKPLIKGLNVFTAETARAADGQVPIMPLHNDIDLQIHEHDRMREILFGRLVRFQESYLRMPGSEAADFTLV